MKTFFGKIRSFFILHKKTSILILLIIIGIGYYSYKKITDTSGQIKYVTTTVQKGTIIASVAGSGQVSASNQVNIQPKVGGQITSVNVSAGDSVYAGQTLFSIDATDAQKAVRDAQASLDSANLNLETAKVQSNNSDTTQQTNVNNAYSALLNSTITAVSSDINNTIVAPTISGTYTKNKEGKIAIIVYQGGNGSYFSVSSPDGIVNSSGTVSSNLPQPIGDTGLYIKFSTSQGYQPTWYIDIPNKLAPNYFSNLNTYNSALQTQQQTNSNSQINNLDIKAKELAVTQAQNSLTDAKQSLSNYYITAPFSGVIASIPVQLGQNVSAGTALATLVTKKQLASISLNEVDVAKINLGQKATLTFDAVDGLTITGKVAEIDTVGTVTSGVVNYAVKISFDTQDNRIKPGMSVSAEIITNVKTDTLVLPNSAVKTKSGTSYVQMFTPMLVGSDNNSTGILSLTPPEQITVQTGLSNDTSIEITSGVIEGDQVVLKTVTSTTATTTTPSLLNAIGGNRATSGAGGATRALRTN